MVAAWVGILAGAALLAVALVLALLLRRSRPGAAPRERAPLPRGKLDHLPREARIAKYGHKHVTMRGDVVQSRAERRIADFLYRRGVRYVYEWSIPGATPDFYLPDSNIVLEHWGMTHSKYRQRRAEKTRLYRAKGFKLVQTEQHELPRLEHVLEARLMAADPHIFETRSS